MLRAQFKDDLKGAMLEKNKRAVATLRLIMAALKDADIGARSKGKPDGIDNDEILGMLTKMVKQRRDSIKMYEDGGRPELAEAEAEEIDVIQKYLPRQLSEDEIEAEVAKVVEDVNATCIKDMGRCMAELKNRYAGQMDFKMANGVLKKKLVS